MINDYLIYAYVDNEEQVVYVGLTHRPKRRENAHRNGTYGKNKTQSSVYKYFKSLNKEVPQPIYLMNGLSSKQAQYWEHWYKEEFISQGFQILNKAKTVLNKGSIGSPFIKWTKEKVFEESKKYSTKYDFQKKSCTAYNVAWKNNWLNEMVWLIEKCHIWTKEEIIEKSKKYNSIQEFREKDLYCYKAACRFSLIDELVWLKRKHYRGNYWTKEKVFEESKKYKTKREFIKNSKGAYHSSIKNNWFDELVWLKDINRKWSVERAIEEGRKYKNKTEFYKKCGSGYEYARKNNLLNIIFEE